MFSFFNQARKQAAQNSKLHAVGVKRKQKKNKFWINRSLKKLPSWLAYISLPNIHLKVEYPIILVGMSLLILTSYHFLPLLSYSDWFQSLMTVLGYSAFVFVASTLYAIYWASNSHVKLRFLLQHIVIISISSAPVFSLSGFNGGQLGLAIIDILEHGHLHKSLIAASAILLGIHSSIHLGNPLVKLIKLSELLIDPFYVEKNQQTQKTNSTQANTVQAKKMQSILNAHSLDYANVIKVLTGPLLTTYEIQLPEGKSATALVKAKNSIARSTKAIDVKIIEQIPGKSTSAIEVTNEKRTEVIIHDLINSKAFRNYRAILKICLGVDSYGIPVFQDLWKMPHLLVAGTTGAGKSVTIRSILYSLLLSSTPEKVQLSLIDPKKVELSAFNHSPFLRHPVITEMNEAVFALEAAVKEMDERYTLINHANKQTIEEYNQFNIKPLPWLVIVIEETADLMLQFPEVEKYIARLAQKARGAGIHLILGTQYPTTNVITGLIKANISARLGMMVSTKVESRVILDQNGAETLRGQGDMYAKLPGHNRLLRLHAPNILQKDITTLTKKHIKQYGKAPFL